MSPPEQSTAPERSNSPADHEQAPKTTLASEGKLTAATAADPPTGDASTRLDSESSHGRSLATTAPTTDGQAQSPPQHPTPLLIKGKHAAVPPSLGSDPDPSSPSEATARAPPPLSGTAAQYLTAEPSNYVDPTPATPITSQPPSRTPSNARSHRSDAHSPVRSDDDDKKYASGDDQDSGSRSEIQSIMEQFSEAGGGPGEDEVMSPRLEIASPRLGGSMQLPLRKSSLEPATPSIPAQLHDFSALRLSTSSPASVRSKDRLVDDQGPPVPPKDGPFGGPSRPRSDLAPSSVTSPTSPVMPVHRPPPPEPEPEPELPFDFHRFLEQLRNKKADPVARYLKSFLSEFGKKQWMVHEQVKIISDFLAFIANKMAQCEVWRDVSDAEFDNAREGMEKLVMNRLYTQTFSPAISPPKPIPGHQEDVERDDILAQKINIYGWVKEEHLDIPPFGDSGRRFLKLAQQELVKIKSYRAPRDKIICVLNCSKVIFGLLKHNKSDSSADSFMPLLIYVVLQSNPAHLVSNVQYILRFRNQDKLGGEAGYYLSSLMGAVQFVENMDRSSLTISDDEFERNVEAAVSAIAEKHCLTSPVITQQATFGEKHAPRAGEAGSSRPSMDGGDLSTPPLSPSSNEGEPRDDGPAITGLLRTIQKPLSTIGRIFSDEPGSSLSTPAGSSRLSASPSEQLSRRYQRDEAADSSSRPSSRHSLSVEEAAARQASAEVAEAQRLQRAEHANIVETLAGMFPDLDREVISDVVYQKEGRVGLAVDACLALST
ncbi:vacuolar sorting protein 9 (VPS9) domain-containing protein [Hirsutella rhossiliensis]|uniref:Vacuolar sorting protein 9 (VPS9) domain-containing protein n=1 Tax=Hirsutella rhossiliensis TaxID=111463 RepID=A0A9P8N2M3_9HYPO|nr:vacuolar sorting protein 9 (VPS9) domain-containing protein [Hirsutella rhossiliensis]KAH0967148.1 vacuolar sorting protein 9 (VPS9) domain-containing protein [Hirsutella rhossiliensis]